MKILFVCLGNICRSPLAQAIADDYIKSRKLDIIVDSAGTGDWHISCPPCENSQKIAKINGLDISSYQARQVKLQDEEEFDYIFALDDRNMADLKQLGFTKHRKLCSKDVPDPFFFDGFEGFEKVFDMIKGCVSKRFDEILSEF
jgi:protein-tyrosine phosphatase